jgi:hypothetical protein
VDYQRLKDRGPSAVTVVKLMMAAHDLAYVNQSLGRFKKAQEAGEAEPRASAGRYLVRVQIAHLSEAMVVVDQMNKSQELLAFLAQCDTQTQASFNILKAYLPGGQHRADFVRLIEKVRHNVAFHYQCDTYIERALGRLAIDANRRLTNIVRGDDVSQWRFQPADEVIDSIVVRDIWQVPEDVPEREGADSAAWDMHKIYLAFMDFAGDFIWKYCEE